MSAAALWCLVRVERDADGEREIRRLFLRAPHVIAAEEAADRLGRRAGDIVRRALRVEAEAWLEGRASSSSSNPYRVGSAMWAAWRDGRRAEELERELRRRLSDYGRGRVRRASRARWAAHIPTEVQS